MIPNTAIAVVKNAADRADWESVPARIDALIKSASSTAQTVKKVIRHLPASDYGYVYYHPERHELYGVLSDSDDENTYQKWHNALRSVKGITRVRVEAEGSPPDRGEWVLIKRARAMPFTLGEKAAFESNPLVNALAGSVLAGGTGYLGGMLLEHLFPEKYMRRGRLRKTLGLAGAGLGSLPGLWQAYANAQNARGAGKPLGVLGSLTTPTNQVPVNPNFISDMQRYGRETNSDYQFQGPDTGEFMPRARPEAPRPGDVPQVDAQPNDIMKLAAAELASYPALPDYCQHAAESFGKLANYFVPAWQMHDEAPLPQAVSKSQFQRALYADPFTPHPIAAAAAGLTEAAAQQYGNRDLLTPKHFLSGLAAAGMDLMTAHVVGGTLGALAGLTPKAQDTLQQMGIWGGLVRGTVGSLLS